MRRSPDCVGVSASVLLLIACGPNAGRSSQPAPTGGAGNVAGVGGGGAAGLGQGGTPGFGGVAGRAAGGAAAGGSAASNGGTGASGGSGAGQAGMRNGGAGQGGTPSEFPPSCIADLTAMCPQAGPCRYELGADGRRARECYDSGVRVEYEYSDPPSMQCVAGSTTTAHWFRSGGAACFTAAATLGAGCVSLMGVWTDSDGTVIARGGIPEGTLTYSIACEGGDSASCESTDPCYRSGESQCVEGECP